MSICFVLKELNRGISFDVSFELFNVSPKLSAHRSKCCRGFATDNAFVGSRLKAENGKCEALTFDWYEQMEFAADFEYCIKKSVKNPIKVSGCYCMFKVI